MSKNQDWNKLRSEITDSAKNILKNTDYENMVDNVKAAAYSAIDEVVASINQKYEKASQEKHLRKELERGIRREERQNLREKYRQSQLSELHLYILSPDSSKTVFRLNYDTLIVDYKSISDTVYTKIGRAHV